MANRDLDLSRSELFIGHLLDTTSQRTQLLLPSQRQCKQRTPHAGRCNQTQAQLGATEETQRVKSAENDIYKDRTSRAVLGFDSVPNIHLSTTSKQGRRQIPHDVFSQRIKARTVDPADA